MAISIPHLALFAGVGVASIGGTLAAPALLKAAKSLGPQRSHFAVICPGGAIWESVTEKAPVGREDRWEVRTNNQGTPQAFTVPRPPNCLTVLEPVTGATADAAVWHPERLEASRSPVVAARPKARD